MARNRDIDIDDFMDDKEIKEREAPRRQREPERPRAPKQRRPRRPKQSAEGFCGGAESCALCREQNSLVLTRSVKIRFAVSFVMLVFGLLVHEVDKIEAAIYAISVLLSGYDVFVAAFRRLTAFDFFDKNVLISLTAVCAFLIKAFPEAAAVMLIFRAGTLLEDYIVARARNSVSGHAQLAADKATVLRADGEVTVPAESVMPGDVIVVRSGARVPLDGTLLDEKGAFDTSAITSDVLPQSAATGDTVLAGYVNAGVTAKIAVTRPFATSAASRIIETVEAANDKKAEPEKLIGRYVKYFAPVMLAAAVLIFAIPTLILGKPLDVWAHRALTLLVISAPCALVISVPLTYSAGIGGAAKKGILFKGAAVVDELSRVSAVAFDKTGTLTTGKFSVADVESEVLPPEKLFMLTAYAECRSNHPLAQSVIAAYGEKIEKSMITEFAEYGGRGVSANISGVRVLAGTADFLADEGVALERQDPRESIIYVAANGQYAGKITLTDTLKKDALRALDNLRKLGVERIAMMTGDRGKVAQRAAVKLGIREIYSEYLPSDKLKKIGEIKAEQREAGNTVFVADGISDSGVLAAADIGISMSGFANDEAVEASDIVMMNDELEKIPEAVEIASDTRKIVLQNIFILLGFKCVAILLAVVGFMPLWLALLADTLVFTVTVLNAARAYDFEKQLLKFN